MEKRTLPTLIAEVGCNHKGDIEIAKEFITTAVNFCGVHHIKFQKRNNKTLLPDSQYNTPHPVPQNSYGATYGEHRENLEFSLDQHRELKAFCGQHGVTYSTSVWDIPSLEEIISLNPDYIKIPSATNTHIELLRLACEEFPGQIHVSLGMTTHLEETQIVTLFHDTGRIKDLVLFACTSGYPIEPTEACLFEITRLKEGYGDDVSAIGYSGHHNGIALDIAAFTLGADYIERHFTLDRTWKGTDHAASLEPDGLRRVQRDLITCFSALSKKPAEILAIEEPQRAKLKWRSPDLSS
ncbi:MAG: N-acetylneuraminate synthase family protein [Gammaproteobacteria bacterium]|jgi:N-acetylneuraminate synthase|nr:N-acetylneuraminate synthase family protein [Gammaproteobacteria bacterium]